MNYAAIDMGNYSLKGIFERGTKVNRIQIPNVIAEAEVDRDYIELEKNPLDGIHVEIISSALSKGRGCYVVGNLATKYHNNDELTIDSKKGESDQPIILLLTAIALDAVENAKAKNTIKIETTYHLSTGLPMSEAKKKGSRKALREKLKNGIHEIRFLDTPLYSGKIVHTSFDEVLVSSEGQAATMELTVNEDGTLKNEDLSKMTYLVHDIGGLSTDIAVVEPNGNVDNVNSHGEKIGVAPYLDNIIREVREVYGYVFRSRKDLEEIIISPLPEIKGHIFLNGNRVDIQPIIDKHLRPIAIEEHKLIRMTWNNVPNTRKAHLIGGGSIILESYIKAENERDKKYPLYFFDAETSIWMIVKSYMHILKLYLKQKQSV
ncbi:Alp7A family actin-like protein [Brevibacillus sp. JB24b]|uniref:Alp7A family actin-like protein n=1 Tax=Brevibacillus sp. JB24b TaxID=3422308 RepID=UPI003F685F51